MYTTGPTMPEPMIEQIMGNGAFLTTFNKNIARDQVAPGQIKRGLDEMINALDFTHDKIEEARQKVRRLAPP